MDEGNSRRTLSPYHEKCFPPYCDNAQQVDKAMVSKMARGDLEDKYITFADENLELKKQNRNQERQIQRLQTAIQRQDKLDKRSGFTPTSMVADGNKVAILEAQNKNLQAKLKVLKQQLMNHSFIHSKENRINDAKMKQAQGRTPRESEFTMPSQSQSAREPKPDKNVAALKMRVAELEDQLETEKNKYKARIAQLEKELSALEKEAGKSGTSVNEQLSETSRQVKDNKELIKLRMLAEKQAAELEELQEKLAAAEEEMEKLRQELKEAKDRADDLEKQLDKERNKSRSAISQASKGSTHSETIRALEEQIRDLKKERDALKDANEKLLELTQTKSEKTPSGHSLQISQLEKNLKDKMEELEEKEARIKELEEQLADAEKAARDAQKLDKAPSQSQQDSAGSLLPESKPQLYLLIETEVLRRQCDLLNFTVQKYWQNVKIHEALLDINRQLLQTCLSKKECENCVDLSKQLCSALMDNAKLKSLLESAQKPKTPPPSPKDSVNNAELDRLRGEVERLQDQVDKLRDEIEKLKKEADQLRDERGKLEDQLTDAAKELATLRPIAVEHEDCRKTPLRTSSSKEDALKRENERLEDELNKAKEELNALRPIAEEHKGCQTAPLLTSSSKEDTLKREKEKLEDELNQAKQELNVLRPIAEEHKGCQKSPLPSTSSKEVTLKRENERLEDELNKAKQELNVLRPIAEEHKDCHKSPLPSTSSKEDALKRENERLEDELNQAKEELNALRPVAQEHKACQKTPLPSTSSKDDSLRRENERLEDELNQAKQELYVLRPIAQEHKSCQKSPLPSKSSKEDSLRRENERLEDELNQAKEELNALRPIAQEHKSCQKTPLPSISSRDDALRRQNERLADDLNRAWQELNVLRPIAEEHKACMRNPTPHTSSKSVQAPTAVPSHVSFKEEVPVDVSAYSPRAVISHFSLKEEYPVEEKTSSVDSEDSVHSRKTIESERYIALTRQLEEAIRENQRLKKELEGRDVDDALKRQNERLEDELNRALRELREVRPIAEEHTRNCPHKEYIVSEYAKDTPVSEYAEDTPLSDYAKDTPVSEYGKDTYVTEYPKDTFVTEYPKEKTATPSSSQYSKGRIKTPTPQASARQSVSSRKERRNQKWPDAKKVISNARKEEIQSESSERKSLDVIMEMSNDENLKEGISLLPQKENLKEENPNLKPTNYDRSEEEESEIWMKNDVRTKERNSELQFQNDDSLKKGKGKSVLINTESLKTEKPEYQFKNNEGLKETKPEFQFNTVGDSKVKTAEPQLKHDEMLNESKSKGLMSRLEDVSGELKKPSLTSTLVNVKRLLRRRKPLRSSTISHSLENSSPPVEEEEAPRQEYVSHVTPPPSIHCAETVDLNDPAQKANLLIVSKHDFETVLMKKKRYSTEVEVVEPVDGRQTLNCKLEICMFDLDVDDKMLEYLSSLQPEPKVYVEWSFVGLDQRTAPLPAEKALFYTNVMYYGPLSTEIKNYLNKVEMPIDLYLVRSSGAPLKVAEGSLDMLQAMEQPNRGFMRSVFLRGKDVPSRYATDKAVATIHCSFILHECCLGDPPFRDQVEVAIGTLYLKNRDGGVVPDHATHIYIEYALLGHCGPDLETDSVPRGEVMKFNHSKKLRVNDDNAPHLKAMLNDDNPRPLRFTVLAEPCSLTTDTEVETVGHADINLNEEMIKRDRDLVSSQVPVYSNEGEHLGTLSVTVLGIGTLQQLYGDSRVPAR